MYTIPWNMNLANAYAITETPARRNRLKRSSSGWNTSIDVASDVSPIAKHNMDAHVAIGSERGKVHAVWSQGGH